MAKKKEISDQNLKQLQQLSLFIRELRINEGYTQAALGIELNLHRNTISKYENNHDICITHLIRIANFFDLSIVDMFET